MPVDPLIRASTDGFMSLKGFISSLVLPESLDAVHTAMLLLLVLILWPRVVRWARRSYKWSRVMFKRLQGRQPVPVSERQASQQGGHPLATPFQGDDGCGDSSSITVDESELITFPTSDGATPASINDVLRLIESVVRASGQIRDANLELAALPSFFSEIDGKRALAFATAACEIW